MMCCKCRSRRRKCEKLFACCCPIINITIIQEPRGNKVNNIVVENDDVRIVADNKNGVKILSKL